MEDIDRHNLPIYNFPFDEEDISEEDYETNTYLRSLLPFSVIGSNEVFDVGNSTMIRGRKYPWGMLDVEDTSISDFVVLRNALLISHLHDLKDYTHEVLYERYRTEALSGRLVSILEMIFHRNHFQEVMYHIYLMDRNRLCHLLRKVSLDKMHPPATHTLHVKNKYD